MYTDYKSLKYLFMQANLNMRHRRWLETINDYQYVIKYHPSKANLVVDALSCKSNAKDKGKISKVDLLLEDMRLLLVEDRSPGEVLAALQHLRINNFEELLEQQEKDWKLLESRKKVDRGEWPTHFSLGEDVILLFEEQKAISNNQEFIRGILAKSIRKGKIESSKYYVVAEE